MSGDKHDSDDEEVPKLARGKGRIRIPQRELMTIMLMLVALFAVVALQKSCATGVGNLFRALEPTPDARPMIRP
jgi:hypothetical protein